MRDDDASDYYRQPVTSTSASRGPFYEPDGHFREASAAYRLSRLMALTMPLYTRPQRERRRAMLDYRGMSYFTP